MRALLKWLAYNMPFIKHIFRTRYTSARITPKTLFFQKVLGFNRRAYWPMHFTSTINGIVENVTIGVGTAPGDSPGCYISAIGQIDIGDYTNIAPNVALITANHDIYNIREHVLGKIRIGRYCWIGMNVVILPDVELGDHTVVGAGAVVTKSFPEGYCVLAGVPAKIIKTLDRSSVSEWRNKYEYYGYIPRDKIRRKLKKRRTG